MSGRYIPQPQLKTLPVVVGSSIMPTLTLSSQEIAQYRSQLAEYPDALLALDAIEDCEGDLEDAAIALAIHIGQQPDCTDWLEGLAKRHRVALCEQDCQNALKEQNLITVVAQLTKAEICPPLLIPLVVLFVFKVGVDSFCEPLNFKITSQTDE